MKLISTLLFSYLTLLGLPLLAQECNREVSDFNTSTTNTVISPLDLWWQGGVSRFEYPKDEGVSPIQNGGFWLSGFVSDTVRASTQLYQRSNFFNPDYEFREGPIGALDSLYFCDVFQITRSSIDQHLADFSDGQLDNPIPEIMNWPGRGNANGPAILLEDDFAPFVDLNTNQIYEPNLGEYPKFVGDQAAWWVVNTKDAPSSFSSNWDAELHVFVQAFNSEVTNQLLKTQFFSASLINRGSAPIDSAALTFRVDPDVGCFTDDAIGSIPDLKLLYAYNIDAVDGTSGNNCDSGVPSYPGAIPVPVTQILSSKTTSPSLDPGINHNATYALSSEDVPRPPVYLIDQTIPLPGIHYNLAHGRFPDGTPFTRGGTGYGGSERVDWPFDGNPADTSSWSSCRLLGRDYKYQLNTTLDNSLPTNERLTVDYAVYIVDSVALPCPSTDLIRDAANEILTFYQQEVSSTRPAFVKTIESFEVFPNPSSGTVTGVLPKGVEITSLHALDITGRSVPINWEKQSNNLTVSLSGSGVFFLVAADTNGKLYRSRVVVE